MSEQLGNATAALDTVVREVNNNLTFRAEYGLGEHPTKGNCYEFADRAHGLLSPEEGNHYIAYAHDHSFNTGVNNQGIYTLSADVTAKKRPANGMPGIVVSEGDEPLIAEVFGEVITDSMRSGSIQGSQAGLMNMSLLERCLSKDQRIATEDYREWFSTHWLKGMMPTIAVMERDFAAEALTNYWNFRRGMWFHDFELVRASLEQLRIRTPQHETRPNYNEELRNFSKFIKRLVAPVSIKDWPKIQPVSSGDAMGLVRAYDEILPYTNAGANVVFGDAYKIIGKKTGSQEAFDAAHDSYERAGSYSISRQRRRNPFIESKVGALDKLIRSSGVKVSKA